MPTHFVMNSPSLLLGAVLAMLGSASLNAGSITLSSVGGAKFATKEGQLLPHGCAVRVGSFNLPNATRDQILPEKGDYAQLKTVFKPLAEGLIGSGSAAQNAGGGTVLRANSFPAEGDIFGTVANINATYMPPETQLYVWVFNHSNPDLATQWGLFTADTWLAPPALGNRTLGTNSVEVLQGSTSGSQLRLIDVPATYGNWAWQSYSINASSTLTGSEADPDGDGLANIAEYAWRLNPAARSTPLTALNAASNGATVSFTFKSPRNQPDVAVIAECSPDLRTWEPAASVVITSDADFDTRQCSSSAGTRYFWRVRFENVP
jgi:hypothetical protein